MTTDELIQTKYAALEDSFNERSRRLWAATEARAIGYGGVSLVARNTGISRRAITAALREIDTRATPPPGRVRNPGAGRKSALERYPDLPNAVERLVEPLTRGDPESPLRWTCKSTRRISGELKKQGTVVSSRVVRRVLHDLRYRLQANRKTMEGKQHPDRNAQFEYINDRTTSALADGQPVISVDTKKKEILGPFANKGRQWRPTGTPERVNDHDFPDPALPRAHPYGVYEVKRNRGFVNVGVDHDTAAFAAASIWAWWRTQGRRAYPQARGLLVTADSGGSNGHRLRLWKWELQRLSDKMGIPISVCHFPPGTSKWNKVEHRLFSSISSNWRGEPLRDYETVINLISRTTTTTGLRVTCRLDLSRYPIGKKVTKEQWTSIHLERESFHGDWNYTIKPKGQL